MTAAVPSPPPRGLDFLFLLPLDDGSCVMAPRGFFFAMPDRLCYRPTMVTYFDRIYVTGTRVPTATGPGSRGVQGGRILSHPNHLERLHNEPGTTHICRLWSLGSFDSWPCITQSFGRKLIDYGKAEECTVNSHSVGCLWPTALKETESGAFL